MSSRKRRDAAVASAGGAVGRWWKKLVAAGTVAQAGLPITAENCPSYKKKNLSDLFKVKQILWKEPVNVLIVGNWVTHSPKTSSVSFPTISRLRADLDYSSGWLTPSIPPGISCPVASRLRVFQIWQHVCRAAKVGSPGKPFLAYLILSRKQLVIFADPLVTSGWPLPVFAHLMSLSVNMFKIQESDWSVITSVFFLKLGFMRWNDNGCVYFSAAWICKLTARRISVPLHTL